METSIVLSQGELQVPCKITIPDSGDIRRVVLGVHGFGGSTMDAIQLNLAEEMALFRSAVVRFDFPGHGENPMPDAALTLRNCADTLLAAARHAKERFPQVEDLCIFATGFGAYVTLTVLPQLQALPGNIKLVVQTPSVLMHETLLSMIQMSRETLRAMDHTLLRAPRPLHITYNFYKELEENIVLAPHDMPMLILHGEADSYIRMEHIQNFRRINEEAKLVFIPGATHQFLEEGAWDMVLDLTRDWFSFQQVLLTDWE